MQPVEVPRRPVAEFTEVIGSDRTARLIETAADFRRRLGGRVIWTFSSTASGGGVAEMLQALVGYTKDLAVDTRWFVIGGDHEFFRITKRVHNRIHGQPGDGGGLGAAERAHVEEVLNANAESIADQVSPGDLVLLHDPQTAGMARAMAERGALVVWRSHIGIDGENAHSRSAWEFLSPFLAYAQGFVFSRRSYAPAVLADRPTWTIPPSIDPFSPKNEPLTDPVARAILIVSGLLPGTPAVAPTYVRRDGSPGEATRPAWLAAEELPAPDDPIVVQVSRWDRLKDMTGVLQAFADHVAPAGPGTLVLAGPAVEGVSDDPEGAAVFAECLAAWQSLPAAQRARAVLMTLPMSDVDENAIMVNALQRHARVIVQKSLAEGFGLTVAEGMWKGRPVVGSAVGGIQDQIVAGTGVLLPDPLDLAGFGRAVRDLLDDPERAERMGRAAREYVRDHFIGDVHLLRYAELFGSVLSTLVDAQTR
jgi:trehalose synthase